MSGKADPGLLPVGWRLCADSRHLRAPYRTGCIHPEWSFMAVAPIRSSLDGAITGKQLIALAELKRPK
jgi:hypothetical protein